MKKMLLNIFSLLILMSFMFSPVIAQVPFGQEPPPFDDFETPERPERQKVPQEILDLFADGITVEEFLAMNQGPIPNAILEFADTPVTVVVILEQPSLSEYLIEEGLNRRSNLENQQSYVNQLKSEQAEVLNQIKTGRSDIQQIGNSFTKVLNGFMLRVPANEISSIREIKGVKSITQAPEYEPTLSASVPLINVDDLWVLGSGYSGEGTTIAVIDSGIDYTHAMLGGSGDPADYAANDPDIIEAGTFPNVKVVGGYDFAGTNYDASGISGSPIPVPDPDPLDELGHGTHVASTAAGIDAGFGSGVAPDALLYAVKVFGENGSTSLTLHGIEWAMDPQGLGHLAEPVDVINMSLGSDWGPADKNDPEFQAVENATALGVVVVASAGNAGNSSYIVGAPSTADSAISVAASTTGFMTSPYLTYAGDNKVPYTTSGNPFTTALTAELVDVSTIAEADALLCNIADVTGNPLANKIALISRGDCFFSEKINNAEALGAVAALIYNSAPGTFGMDTTGSTLPAGSLSQSDGVILLGETPIEITIGPDSNVMTFTSDTPPDTIASFSSRGPRGFDSKLKPEITAPGVSIFAAEMGSGSNGVSMGGTSMAAPHIAGVAALLTQAHPDWDPVHIKAAMMNTAVDLADAASSEIPRQGAGRVDALAAAETCIAAYADPELVSLSWGVIELDENYSETTRITLVNFCDTEVTLDVTTAFTSVSTGATLTSSVASVTVPAAPNIASVDVTLDLVAADMPIDFGGMEEYYGFVSFDNEAIDPLRIPFYFVPRPFTEISEVETKTKFEINDLGYAYLDQSGPVSSNLWAYPVTMVSDDDPSVLDNADLRYIGMDYGWLDSSYGDIFIPAFAMWDDVHTNQPYFSEIDLYIDADQDGVPETVDFNFNLNWFLGYDDNNQWFVVQVDLASGILYPGSPYLIGADFNSGVQEWYLPANWHFVTGSFDYEVLSFDWYGTPDYAGMASFDIYNPPLEWLLVNDMMTGYALNPQNEAFWLLFGVSDWDAYRYAGVQGIMLLDYYGKPGLGQSYYWPLDVYSSIFFPIFNQ